MKKSLIRLLALCLMLAMIVPLAASCGLFGGDDEDPDDTTTGIITAPTDGYKTDLSTLTYTDLDAAALAGYSIVYSELASSAVIELATELAAAIKTATGVELPVKSDAVALGAAIPTDVKEIRVGVTNRDAGYGWLRYYDYRIEKSGDDLVIAAGGDEALADAVALFTENMLTTVVRLPNAACDYLAYYVAENLYIGGIDVAKYTIVTDSESFGVGEYLCAQIRALCGITVPVVSSSASEAECEILIGNVVRAGVTYPASGKYTVCQVGNKIVLGGVGAGAGNAAAIDFVKNTLATDTSKKGETLAFTVDARTKEYLTSGLFKLNLPENLGSMAGKYDLDYSTDTVLARFMAAKAELPEKVTVLDRFLIEDYPLSLMRQVFVSPNGDDSNPGTQQAPVATLDEALSRMSYKGGGTIWLMDGLHEIKNTANITAAHSGTAAAPLFIKAWNDEEATLSANNSLDMSKDKWYYFDPVENADIWARVPAEARDSIMWTTLDLQGWDDDDIAEITPEDGPPSMYVNGNQYTLARYPNSDEPLDLLYFTKVYDTGTVCTSVGTDLWAEWQKRAGRYYAALSGTATQIGWEIALPDRNFLDPETTSNDELYKADDMAAEVLSWVNTGDIWYFGSTFEGWEFAHYNLALTHTEAGGTRTWGHRADLDGDGEYDTFDITGDGIPDDVYYLGYPRDFAGDTKGTYANGTNKEGSAALPYHPNRANGGTYYSLKSTTPSYHGAKHSGNSAAGRNTYYLYNAIEALDAPGEWFLDRNTGRLYIFPSYDDNFFKSEISFSPVDEYDLLYVRGASNVIIDGLTINGSSGRGVYVENSDSVIIQNNTALNIRRYAAAMEGCTNSAIIYSDFSRCGSGMVNVSGSIYNLAPCNVVVQNNFFHDALPTIQTAVSCGSIRTVVSHNYFQNTVVVGGAVSEAIVEYNRFEGGSADVVDGGMIYFAGWTSRSNHFRYNVFDMFNATHNAVYNDTQCSGNYMYYNIVSTIGSRSNANKGWYSSSGIGNVCFGNLMVLRTPNQVDFAGSAGGDEGTLTGTGPAKSGDGVDQSDLFYYDFGITEKGDWGSGTLGTYKFVSMDGEPIVNLSQTSQYGTPYRQQFGATQSLAGHWWEGLKDAELSIIGSGTSNYYNTEAWYDRNPEYVNMLQGTALIRRIQEDANSGYHGRYFYAPWKLSGRTYTFDNVPVGTVLTIPEYRYVVEEGGELVYKTAEKHSVTVGESGTVTLTYEEIAAMERMRRQPSFCVVMNNVFLGGTPQGSVGNWGGKDSTVNTSMVVTDRAKGHLGYVPTALESNNFFHYYYPDITPSADKWDYTVAESTWDTIGEAVDLEAVAPLLKFGKDDTGIVDWTEKDYAKVFFHDYEQYMGWK